MSRVLYTPLDLPLHTCYSPEQWNDWIVANDVEQIKYANYRSRGLEFPWGRVEVFTDSPLWNGLVKEFPKFIEHIKKLPINIERLIFVKQKAFIDAPFHTDLDPDGIGFRVCLAGDFENPVFKVCAFEEPIDLKVIGELNYPPHLEFASGIANPNAIKALGANTVYKPKGIGTGVTWAVTSWYGLHGVDKLEMGADRIQVIVFGSKNIAETEELLARSITDKNSIVLNSK
jgi:hypothetical protein